MHLRLERWASPISPLLLVTDTKGILRALEYADYQPRMHWLLRRHYGSYTLEEGAAPLSLTQALDAYFAGCIDVLAGVEIATGGTPFQRRVWRALSAIPAGSTVSYGQLAVHLGENRASRAVGAANGANPIAIVVPCHRVIGANGGLTGYAGGLRRKQWLLEHEASFSTLAACEKAVSKTADRSERPRVWPRSIQNRLPAVVPQCRASSLVWNGFSQQPLQFLHPQPRSDNTERKMRFLRAVESFMANHTFAPPVVVDRPFLHTDPIHLTHSLDP